MRRPVEWKDHYSAPAVLPVSGDSLTLEPVRDVNVETGHRLCQIPGM